MIPDRIVIIIIQPVKGIIILILDALDEACICNSLKQPDVDS